MSRDKRFYLRMVADYDDGKIVAAGETAAAKFNRRYGRSFISSFVGNACR